MGFDHAGRLERARAAAGTLGLDAVLVAPSADLRYLVGYDPPPLERLTCLALRPGSAPVLIVPALERPLAVATVGSLAEIAAWGETDDPYALVASTLGRPRRVACSDRMWAAHLLELQATLPRVSFASSAPVLAPLRAVKDTEEVELLRRAGRGADETFHQIAGAGLEGRTEQDVAGLLGEHLIALGHDEVTFTIVGSGPNGASPHHGAGKRRIERGDAVVLDFGGRLSGYCSDITRTVIVGEPEDELLRIHGSVRAAQERAFAAVRPGVAAQEVDRAARAVIDDAGFGDRFIHRTGHGIGLEEHEDPYIVEGNETPLEAGMCFSIEPGIYLEGRFGVRIEDIVTVTEERAERLNEAPRDLAVVA